MVFQQALIPPRVLQVDPLNLGTADCEYICEADDGITYAVKTVSKKPLLPASEWICHSLAGLCGIPCPVFERVQLLDGSIGFGSRWEGGVIPRQQQLTMFSDTMYSGMLRPFLSRIFAFDLFIANEDRHRGNFLIRESRNSFAILAFDFSRAWFFRGWPLAQSLPLNCQTLRTFRDTSRIHGWDLTIALDVLSRIQQVTRAHMEGIIGGMPSAWIEPQLVNEVLNWWDSDRQARIDEMRARVRSV